MDEEVEQNWRRVGKRKYRSDRRTCAAVVANKRSKMLTWNPLERFWTKDAAIITAFKNFVMLPFVHSELKCTSKHFK